MISNQIIRQVLKFTNNRYFSHSGKSKADNVKGNIHATKKDPEVEVFGKKIRTGDEAVDAAGGEKLDIFSPMPEEMREGKVVRIYQRSKHVMQQGTNNTKDWILEFGTEERWENPTMGWCSSGNPVSNVFMIFPSMCAAVCYAEKQNLKYVLVETKPKKEFKSNYSKNFSWNKRTRVSTK